MYVRKIEPQIKKWMFFGKIIILYGARQVGKTTLLKKIIKSYPEKKVLFLNADESSVRDLLKPKSFEYLKNIIGNPDILVIDEAQRVKNIGLILKILHDNFSELQILVTGSSSLSLANTISEPLTGRSIEFKLYPLALNEISENAFDASKYIDSMLLWGSYPDIFKNDLQKREVLLKNLTEQYLYQDVLEFERIKKPALLKKLLQLLAFQIGSEVSLSELSQKLEMDKKTVEKYLDLLEKSFVIFNLPSFSRNLRKELTKSKKYYFYDLGVRNKLIESFLDLDIRNDRGALFENFVILERLKHLSYTQNFVNFYFWRTYDQKEIDLIEEKNGEFKAIEIKYKINKSIKFPKDFKSTYPNSEFFVIDKENIFSQIYN